MIADNCRISTMIVAIGILLVNIAYGQSTKIETSTATKSLNKHTISEDSSQKDSDGKPKESGGFFPIGKIHEVIREERVATLREIDTERKETLAYLTQERKVTLAYLTQERKAVVEELEKKINRIADLLQSERRATMVEMEAIGNRITENAILKSEKLIDHFFIRVFQFALILILFVSILGFIIFRIVAKSR